MPLRDYYCDSCQHQWEEFIRPSDEEPTECPRCHAGPVSREFSTPGGYHINGNNSASVRPKSAGYRSKK